MKKEEKQLRKYFQESIPERDSQSAENFTRKVMSSLPQRKSLTFRSLLLSYIQSPLWLITAFIICVAAVIFMNPIELPENELLQNLHIPFFHTNDFLSRMWKYIIPIAIVGAFFEYEIFSDLNSTSSDDGE